MGSGFPVKFRSEKDAILLFLLKQLGPVGVELSSLRKSAYPPHRGTTYTSICLIFEHVEMLG